MVLLWHTQVEHLKNLKLDKAGIAIRRLRENKGIGLNELSESIQWDKSRLSRYENNQVGLSLEAIEIIASGLDLPPVYIIIECLKEIYPHLIEPGNKTGLLLKSLAKEVLKG